MRERASVWAARALLFVPMIVAIAWVCQLTVGRTTLWPYGSVSHLGVWVPVLASYVVGGAIGCVVAWAFATQAWFTFQTIWCVAWRKPHIRLSRRWAVFDNPGAKRKEKYSERYVEYDKPQPLVRGRIGSR